jgi:outer membrane protein OmpA-like peptidoglycan-associated protein
MRLFAGVLLACTILVGCKSTHSLDTSFDLREGSERMKQLVFTTTRNIDSVDVQKLMVDVWKVEHYAYPDTIKLFVRVLDSTGNVITHMAQPYAKPGAPNYFSHLRESLGAKRRKKVVDVSPFTVREFGEQDSIPTSIALAVDYSGSMKGVLSWIEQGTEIFISLMRPCDRISLTTFAKDITPVFPLTSDTSAMLRAYREHRKKALGMYTSSIDGLMKALKSLDTVPIEQPKVCVFFTDGDENTSFAKMSDIFDYAVKKNISIYCVGFGYAQDEPLEALSLYTGGKYYHAYSKAELNQIFMDIYRSLRNYYLITYHPPQYDGLHVAELTIDVPGRDSMVARATYDKTPLNPLSPTDEFTRRILFAYNKADIDTTSLHIIDEIADALERFERVELEIQGHTDNIGGEEFNAKLSLARAEAVKSALIARGIEERRLRTKGYGFMLPVASNETEEGRAQNRRTVFKILRK